jgi:hypothetical protein
MAHASGRALRGSRKAVANASNRSRNATPSVRTVVSMKPARTAVWAYSPIAVSTCADPAWTTAPGSSPTKIVPAW